AHCVAARGLPRPPAPLRHLAHALLRFLSEVRAVELSQGRHDVLYELALDRFVHLLHGGSQPDVLSFEECAESDVILKMPGESIELVDEDDIHPWRLAA